MYPEYEKQKQRYKNTQKTAYKKGNDVEVLKLFAKRHMLAALYYEVDSNFPIEKELNEIGTKMVEWFELEFNTESTIEDDGFAPKNLKFPWSINAFLFNSEPYIVNAEIRKLQQNLVKNRKDDFLEYDNGIVSRDQQEEASEFLNEMRNVLLIREDDVQIGRKTIFSNPGITDEEEKIIKDYLQIYISSKWQETLEENVENYAIIEMFKDSIKNDILSVNEEETARIAENIGNLKTGATNELAKVMANVGIGDREKLEETKEKKRKEILSIIREKSKELSTNMVNKMLDKGMSSQKSLSDFRQQQQNGWNEINAIGRFGIAKQFASIGVDIIALSSAYNEVQLNKKYFKKLEYKDPKMREELPEPTTMPDFTDEVPLDVPSNKDYDYYGEINKKELAWLDKVKTTNTTLGKCYDIIKVTYGLLKPFMIFMSLFFPGGLPAGILGVGLQIIQALVYVGVLMGIINTLGVELPELSTPPGTGSYWDIITKAVTGAMFTVFVQAMMFIGVLTSYLIDGIYGRYIIMAIALLNIFVTLGNITADYTGRGGKAGFKTAVLNANLKLKSDMSDNTFNILEIDKEIEESMEGGSGNMKEVSRRVSALTTTVNSVMKVKDENRATVKETALMAGVATGERMAEAAEESNKISLKKLRKMLPSMPFRNKQKQTKFERSLPDVETKGLVSRDMLERFDALEIERVAEGGGVGAELARLERDGRNQRRRDGRNQRRREGEGEGGERVLEPAIIAV